MRWYHGEVGRGGGGEGVEVMRQADCTSLRRELNVSLSTLTQYPSSLCQEAAYLIRVQSDICIIFWVLRKR